MWRPLGVTLAADEAVGELLVQPSQGDICSMRGCPILLEPLCTPVHPVLTPSSASDAQFSPKFVQDNQVALLIDSLRIALCVFKKERSDDSMFGDSSPSSALD